MNSDFSDLNTQIQEKHRKIHKHNDTYNALMETKEFMLKETSLLDSITVQVISLLKDDSSFIKEGEGVLLRLLLCNGSKYFTYLCRTTGRCAVKTFAKQWFLFLPFFWFHRGRGVWNL